MKTAIHSEKQGGWQNSLLTFRSCPRLIWMRCSLSSTPTTSHSNFGNCATSAPANLTRCSESSVIASIAVTSSGSRRNAAEIAERIEKVKRHTVPIPDFYAKRCQEYPRFCHKLPDHPTPPVELLPCPFCGCPGQIVSEYPQTEAARSCQAIGRFLHAFAL